MNALVDFSHLETALYEDPIFSVEAPDGLKHLSELDRVGQFRKLMKQLAPRVMVFANANAGRRSPAQARKEGIRGGVFDYTVVWTSNGRGVAWPEFKGYTAAGRPGGLRPNQINWGNDMVRLGHDVACFFDPMNAVEWLRSLGCPIRPVHNQSGRL